MHDDLQCAETVEELREQLERYRAIAEFAYDLLYWKAPDGRFTYVSPSSERVTGYPADHFRTIDDLIDIIHPEDRGIFEEHAEHKYNRNAMSIEFRIVHRDGSVRRIEHICGPMYDKDDEYLGRLASSRDITARKQAEDDVRRSKETLQSIIDSSPSAMYVKDLEGRLLLVNRALAELLGTTKEEMIGKTSYDFYAREVAEDHIANDRAVLESGDIYEAEEIVPREGYVQTFISQKFPLRSESGEIYGIAGISTEITDRKHAEEEAAKARESAERSASELQSVISNMADGVVVVDADGRIIFVNDTGRRIFEVPDDQDLQDWMSRYKLMSVEGEPMPIEQSATMRALRGETVRDTRYRWVLPWGKEVVVSVSASPIMDAAGRIVGATNTFRDETERYEREKRITEMLQDILIAKPESMIPCCEVGVKYEAAMEEAQVGGDFFDIFDVGGGKYGILIGDVAGKGFPAARRVAAVRYAVRNYAYIDRSPARVLTLANNSVWRETVEDAPLVTAFLAILDVASGLVKYSNAGHETVLLVSSRGEIEEITLPGVALGVMKDCVYSEGERQLCIGDMIVMVTDGVTEARIPGNQLFGIDGVKKCLDAVYDAPAERVADKIVSGARTFCGGKLHDDAAIVAFRFLRGRHEEGKNRMEAIAGIESSEQDGDIVVIGSGELDLYSVSELNGQLTTAVESGRSVVVDLTSAKFIDSAVLGCVLVAAKSLGKHGKRIKVIVAAESHPLHVIEEVGFGSIMDIVVKDPPNDG